MKNTLILAAVAALAISHTAVAQDAAPAKEAPKMLTPPQMMEKRDANKDGKLSKEEYLSAFKKPEKITEFTERFGKLDTNSDGFVTLEELQAGNKPKAGAAGKKPAAGKDKKPADQ